jgi:hypothetical protein
VASDVSSPEFRRRVLSGKRTVVALPKPEAVADPAVRAAVTWSRVVKRSGKSA